MKLFHIEYLTNLDDNIPTTVPVQSEGPCKEQLKKLGDDTPPGAFIPKCNSIG